MRIIVPFYPLNGVRDDTFSLQQCRLDGTSALRQ